MTKAPASRTEVRAAPAPPVPGLAGSVLLALGLLSAGIAPVPAAHTAVHRSPEVIDRWTGDLDGMLERRRIRVLVSYSKTFYFLDGPEQRGSTYELMQQFEKTINAHIRDSAREVEVIIIPVSRDQLLPGLLEGRGDIAAANLTITPERKRLVDFSAPMLEGVREILVTGPAAPEIETVADLRGERVYVRESSSYYQSLVRLNTELERDRLEPVELELVNENLEDEDLLEMVNAGLIPMIVIDDHKGEFWAQVFDHIVLHPDVAVRTGGRIAWAFRKDSPKLERVINDFVADHKKGTLIGNVLFERYLRDNEWVRNSLAERELKRFRETATLFQRYADRYGFDWLMLAALGYQESGLDQSERSPDGAIGVMQLLPSTAADDNVGIDNIEKLENNIHAGVKYLHFLHERYFHDEDMSELDEWLFTFAAYNAGARRVQRLRKTARKMGLDPDQWFGHVEVAAARKVGRETVDYVRNILKYYVAYREALKRLDLKEAARSEME